MSRDAILGNALAIGCLLSALPWRGTPRASSPSVSAISVQPAEVVLQGSRASQRVLVTGQYGSSSLESDLTALATYESLDPSVATVTPDGIVSPRGPGQATLLIRYAAAREPGASSCREIRSENAGRFPDRGRGGTRARWLQRRVPAMGLHKARVDSVSACAGSTPSLIS